MNPLVSVCCLTYNHGNYVRDAIEGFLMQKTSFPFEIIIHDDASTDNTVQIIKEYAEKNKDKLIPILQLENQFSRGFNVLLNYVFSTAKGKYIAFCEGDDYWTDPLKLQKQVSYLEANPECSLCFHAAIHVNESNLKHSYIHRPKDLPRNNRFSIGHCIMGGGSLITTNSMLFLRKYVTTCPHWLAIAPVGDLPLMLFLATKGEVGYIDEIMSVYRIMTANSWSRLLINPSYRRTVHVGLIRMWNNFDHYTEYKYHSKITYIKSIHRLVHLQKSFLSYLKLLMLRIMST